VANMINLLEYAIDDWHLVATNEIRRRGQPRSETEVGVYGVIGDRHLKPIGRHGRGVKDQ